jgi:hypothetical protein
MKPDTNLDSIFSSHHPQPKPTRDFVKREIAKAKKEIQKIEQQIDRTEKLLTKSI